MNKAVETVKAFQEVFQGTELRPTSKEAMILNIENGNVIAIHVSRAQAIADELATLRETVAKLPKTADGVPVVPWMKVWVTPHSTATVRNLDENGDSNRFSKGYSTEAAARAAGEQ